MTSSKDSVLVSVENASGTSEEPILKVNENSNSNQSDLFLKYQTRSKSISKKILIESEEEWLYIVCILYKNNYTSLIITSQYSNNFNKISFNYLILKTSLTA